MTEKRKLGIYGGTFSPPHKGHVEAVRAFLSYVKPDSMLIIPDYLPPHKTMAEEVSAEDRLEMTRLAFSELPEVIVSALELERGGKSYTVETLKTLTAENTELYFLCGTDMFLTLDSWFDFETIFRLAKICCVRREADSAYDAEIQRKKGLYEQTYGASIVMIPNLVHEISSTQLREKLKCARADVDMYLPFSVLAYIREKGLYSYGSI